MNSDHLVIYGSTTSPYVRRVRMVAEDLRLSHELIDSVSDAGQSEMRLHNPLWKVPTVRWQRFGTERVVFDSHAIVEALWGAYGNGSFRAFEPRDLEERNLVNAIDGALDAAVHLFYMKRDGVNLEQVPYLVKQRERIASALSWVSDRLVPGGTLGDRFGYAELAGFTAFEWFRFRSTVDLTPWPALQAFTDRHRDRFSNTAPKA